MNPVDDLNRASEKEAFRRLFHCCGSEVWARTMVEGRPYQTVAELEAAAARAFDALGPGQWLEAFRHHPKIGDLQSLRRKFKDTAHLAGQEQAGVAGSSDATLLALAEGNRAYEDKFGFIFIVCATGKTAAEMLALLEARLGNDREAELRIAAAEQRKITALRLQKVGAP